METWISPINPTNYNIEGAFTEFESIPLRKNNYNYNVGDIVYLYLSTSQYQYLGYKTEVIDIFSGSSDELWDKEYCKKLEVYKGDFIKVKLLNKFEFDVFTLEKLVEFGLNKNSLKGPQKCFKKRNLLKFINSTEQLIRENNKEAFLHRIEEEEKYINKVIQYIDLDDTEKEAIIKSRIGQGEFRNQLLSRDKKCVICSLEKIELLVASHIKPWSSCENGTERWDENNGLCLCSLHDALFDKGLITFNENTGEVIYSERLSETDKKKKNIPSNFAKNKDDTSIVIRFEDGKKTIMESSFDNGVLKNIF